MKNIPHLLITTVLMKIIPHFLAAPTARSPITPTAPFLSSTDSSPLTRIFPYPITRKPRSAVSGC